MATRTPARRRRSSSAEPAARERSWKTALAVTGAIVGVASGLVGLVFTLLPNLKPEPSPNEQEATLSAPTLDPSASFGQYLARIDQPTSGYTSRQLARRGALVEFRVSIVGFRGSHLRLKWELFDDASGRQVDESKAVVITPNKDKNAARWQFWIPVPHRKGPFFAVAELLEQKKHTQLQLDTLETGRFSGLAAT